VAASHAVGGEASAVGGEASAGPVLAAEAESGATTNQAPPGEAQKPELSQPPGGPRPGTGRLL
jgi:hypothetical protein